MTMTSKCQAKNPAFCRYHGDTKKLAFQKRVEQQLKMAEEKFEELRYDSERLEEAMDAQDFFELAKTEYAATVKGEEELRAEIEEETWPERQVLEDRLEAALAIRAEQEEEDNDSGEYTFPASKLADAVNRIEKANRKLARAGVDERFTYTVEEFIDEDENGNKFSMVSLQMSHPSLSVAGWDFVAAVDATPDGDIVTRVLPGQELNGEKPSEQLCEHCGSNRRRKATYMLRNGDGEFKQVGSNCLESFLGVTPKGLWALSYDMEEMGKIDKERRYGGPDTVLSLQKTVAYALAVSDGGNNFMTRNSAESYGTSSTADEVRRQLFDFRLKADEKVDPTPYMEKAAKIIKETPITGDNDYASNMRTILKTDNLGVKQMGMAVSVIAAANREKWLAEKAETKANAPKSVGFLGAKDTKIKDFSGVIKRIDHYDGDYGTSTRLIMTAPDGKEVVWTASKYLSLEEGSTVKLKSATIKGQGSYNGNDQTILTRARIELDEDSV